MQFAERGTALWISTVTHFQNEAVVAQVVPGDFFRVFGTFDGRHPVKRLEQQGIVDPGHGHVHVLQRHERLSIEVQGVYRPHMPAQVEQAFLLLTVASVQRLCPLGLKLLQCKGLVHPVMILVRKHVR